MAGCVDLTIEAVPAGARFVDDMQFAISIAELLEHPGDSIAIVSDAAVEAHITRLPLSNSYGNRFLVNIEPEKSDRIRHGPSPCA
jgi:hypothetical protein